MLAEHRKTLLARSNTLVEGGKSKDISRLSSSSVPCSSQPGSPKIKKENSIHSDPSSGKSTPTNSQIPAAVANSLIRKMSSRASRKSVVQSPLINDQNMVKEPFDMEQMQKVLVAEQSRKSRKGHRDSGPLYV